MTIGGEGAAARSTRSLHRLLEHVGTMSPAGLAATVTVLGAMVFGLDIVTGADVSVSIFYVLPVGMLAWRWGSGVGVGGSVVAALLWLVADRLGGSRTDALVPVWNSIVRLAFLAVIAALVATVHDLLEQQGEKARTDALTGVLNARGFRERAEAEFARARRSGLPVTVAYIDLDDFKRLNDSSGHSAGDATLERIGAALRGACRAADMVARMGGDEFAVLLPDTSEAEARVVVERIRAAALAACEGSGVGLSIGVVTLLDPRDDLDAALRTADALMYEVKARGRGSVEYRTEERPR